MFEDLLAWFFPFEVRIRVAEGDGAERESRERREGGEIFFRVWWSDGLPSFLLSILWYPMDDTCSAREKGWRRSDRDRGLPYGSFSHVCYISKELSLLSLQNPRGISEIWNLISVQFSWVWILGNFSDERFPPWTAEIHHLLTNLSHRKP